MSLPILYSSSSPSCSSAPLLNLLPPLQSSSAPLPSTSSPLSSSSSSLSCSSATTQLTTSQSSSSSSIASNSTSSSSYPTASKLLPEHIVKILGGANDVDKLPFIQLPAMRLSLDWCPKHQRNFAFYSTSSQQKTMRGVLLSELPKKLKYKDLPGPIVTGLIGDNPVLLFKIAAYPLLSRKFICESIIEEDASSLIFGEYTPKRKDLKSELTSITIGSNYSGTVAGILFNPILSTSETQNCYATQSQYFGDRSFTEMENCLWSYKCKELSKKEIDNCLSSEPPQKYGYFFGQIDTDSQLFPLDSAENFLNIFVMKSEAFVFVNWYKWHEHVTVDEGQDYTNYGVTKPKIKSCEKSIGTNRLMVLKLDNGQLPSFGNVKIEVKESEE